MKYTLNKDQKYSDRYSLSLNIGGTDFESSVVKKKEEWAPLRKTRYFQLRERADNINSIGVISSSEGKFDTDSIQDALENHFDERVFNIKIEDDHYSIIISFDMEDKDEREYVDGEQTWLYI